MLNWRKNWTRRRWLTGTAAVVLWCSHSSCRASRRTYMDHTHVNHYSIQPHLHGPHTLTTHMSITTSSSLTYMDHTRWPHTCQSLHHTASPTWTTHVDYTHVNHYIIQPHLRGPHTLTTHMSIITASSLTYMDHTRWPHTCQSLNHPVLSSLNDRDPLSLLCWAVVVLWVAHVTFTAWHTMTSSFSATAAHLALCWL